MAQFGTKMRSLNLPAQNLLPVITETICTSCTRAELLECPRVFFGETLTQLSNVLAGQKLPPQ
jgi:hypothetical protein